MRNQWIIEQSDFDTVENIKRYESLFTLGNGYLGLRGDLIFSGKAIQKGTYINGFYEKGLITYGEKAFGFAENWQTMIPLPEGKEVNISINGKKLFNNRGKFLENKRILDLKESKSVWEFIWKDESNLVYKGKVTTLVPFSFEGTAIFIWDLILPEDKQSISIDSFLLFDNIGDSDLKDPRLPAHFNGSSITLEKKVVNQDKKILNVLATGSSLTLSCAMDHLVEGIEIKENKIDELDIGYCSKLSGKAGRKIQLTKVLSYSYNSSKHIESTEKTVINEQNKVKNKGISKILEEQRSYMEKYWQYGDIEIKGNEEAQISLRFNLFQMLQSTGKDGKRSIAAKGLSGPGYEGHYFWDAETYILPYFIYTNPSIARSMLEYRILTINGAKERAKLLGHDGVLFPWRTINGEESSAYFPAGTAQYHVNADIALGLVKYLEITDDMTLLEEGGYDLLAGTARFWCSLGSKIEGKGFCFNLVTGPDEYTALVDNNYYTNLMAKENLVAAAFWLKDFVSAEEISLWSKRAEDIFLPENWVVTPQDDSFLEKEIWDFKNTKDSEYPLLLNFHPLNIYRKQVLKQADVVLAQTLCRNHFPPGLLKRNFDYYEELTTRDSSLSACSQGINAHWLGYEDLSWKYFLETVHTDRLDLHKNVFYGLHTAAMGGSCLMIMNGYLGLENIDQTVRFRPCLPDKIDRISLHILLRGNPLKVELDKTCIRYTAIEEQVEFYHFSRKIVLRKGEYVTMQSSPDLRLTVNLNGEDDFNRMEQKLLNEIQCNGVLPEEVLVISENGDIVSRLNDMGIFALKLAEEKGVDKKELENVFNGKDRIKRNFKGKQLRN